ncbi:MAG: glycine--tRNA ligase subunit beta [candidate division WOR-3 bacterium]
MKKTFLLEIGTEELPPAVIAPAAAELERRIRTLLTDEGVAVGQTELFYTPRRIAVRLSDVSVEKPAQVVEVQGPPKKAAFDEQGRPTRTAVGFSAAQGKTVADIYVKSTPRGDYCFLQKEMPSVPTVRILEENLPRIIASLPFPKTMRWQQGKLRFARPIRWLLSLFDSEIVAFDLEGIVAGNLTYGHRIFGPEPIVVPEPYQYPALLEQKKVIASPRARRGRVESELQRAGAAVSGEPLLDKELLDETVNITEWPEALLGNFNPGYLKLPKEVLATALKMHQRCFAVQGPDGQLLPHFIAVTNTPGCQREQVCRWYERAIDSRLRDAQFFFEADLQTGLAPLVEEEKRVVWIEGMGSYFDKTERLRRLCRYLARRVPDIDDSLLDRAAELSKADLLTQLVREKEFTALEGIMGGIYARLLGELREVADAIAEHYRPRSLDDELPRTRLGALLSIADKMDNITGAFLTGVVPTGSEDPLLLRRQSTGLLLTILEHRLPIVIDELIQESLGCFEGLVKKGLLSEVAPKLHDLFRERMAGLLADREVAYDVANAVLATHWHSPAEALGRAQALGAFRSRAEFERLIIGQKRVANILRDQLVDGLPEPELFREPAESALWEEARKVEPVLAQALTNGDYGKAFELLLSLRGPIDRLFDDVLVMAEDAKLRTNRLRLLKFVQSLFLKVADLSQIVLEGEAQ